LELKNNCSDDLAETQVRLDLAEAHVMKIEKKHKKCLAYRPHMV
jgi:hypothetical protein